MAGTAGNRDSHWFLAVSIVAGVALMLIANQGLIGDAAIGLGLTGFGKMIAAPADLRMTVEFLICLIVLMRPLPPGGLQYFLVMAGVCVVSFVVVAFICDTLAPASAMQGGTVQPLFTAFPDDGRASRDRAAAREIDAHLSASVEGLRRDYIQEIKSAGLFEALNTGTFLTDPRGTQARLAKAGLAVTRARARFAAAIAEARKAFQSAAISDTQKAESLKWLDRDADNWTRLLGGYWTYLESFIAEQQAILNDFRAPHEPISLRGDRIYFSSKRDRDAYDGHMQRLDAMTKRRQAEMAASIPKPL